MSLFAGSDFSLFRLDTPLALYYAAFGVLLLALAALHRLIHAPFGMALRGCQANERRMRALGYATLRYRLAAYVLSAMLCGVAGVLLANLTLYVSPSYLAWTTSGELIVMVALGGMGTLFGPVAGALAFLLLEEGLKLLTDHWMLPMGLLIVGVVLLSRRGLYGALPETPWRPAAARPALPHRRTAMSALRVEHLLKRYGGLTVTDDLSLEVRPGELHAVIGPNGAGKTTVFNLLSGFLSPDQGSVSMLNARGEWVSCKTPDAFAHQGLGRTFQIAKPFTGLTVLENIMLGAFIRTSSRDEAEQIALRVAEQTDLTRHLDTEARNLTVGGMKRLEVARALAIQPRILLLDEVMAGLNPTDIEKSIQMIRRIRDSGVSVLLIEHMMQATMALSDRIVVLNEGAVLVSGAPRDVVENPAVIEAYLGKEYQDA